MLWIKIEVTDICTHLILKVKAIQKCQHCQLCIKGRLHWVQQRHHKVEYKLKIHKTCPKDRSPASKCLNSETFIVLVV